MRTQSAVARGEESLWYALPAEDIAARFGTHLTDGLTRTEAEERLRQYGPNTLTVGRGVSVWAVLLHQFTSPLIYLLLAALAITLLIQHWTDAAVIGAVLVINTTVGFIQEYRAERAMQALLALVAPMATVVRDGVEHEVPSSAVVPGDLVVVRGGDIVPADLRLVRATRLEIDESLLTGESTPVSKGTEPLPASRPIPLAERRNMAFMGTVVTAGRGVGVVVATGSATQVGHIAQSIQRIGRQEVPLQRRLASLGRFITFTVIGAGLVVLVWSLLVGSSFQEALLTTVAMTVAVVPEGLPVAVTIALAVGVRRMARRRAIVRRLAAVETLGSCTVVVSDKTGTLTENSMTVQRIWAGGETFALTGSGRSLRGEVQKDGQKVSITEGSPLYWTLVAGVMTNEASVTPAGDTYEGRGDPTEVALLVAGAKVGLWRRALLERYPLVTEIPFDPPRQFSASIHHDGSTERVFVKGAPERVLAMCDALLTPDGPRSLDAAGVAQVARQMASEGLRVLGMAMGIGEKAVHSTRAGTPQGLVFLGLQGMWDPPRPEAIEALRAARRAGIRVLMVTGDHAGTAAAIAQRMGLTSSSPRVVTGADLEGMADSTLEQVMREVVVFARVTPQQKLRIVEALRRQGEVVAVTGDGVNDAPALKSAHIGVAMGRSGTAVAKEASDIVLVDDNFATIYAAIEEGRTSFANIRKVTFFLVSTGVGALISIFAALALGMPIPYLPAQLLWLNLVTNGVQDVALAFEPGERWFVHQPPRPPNEPILNRRILERTVLVGLVLAAGTLGLFAWELGRGADLDYARVTALTTMVLFQNFNVGNSRSERLSAFALNPLRNPFLFVGTVGAVALHIGAMHFGPTQFVLGLQPLSLESWLRILPVAVSVVLVVEVHKLLRR
ncbi:MAG: HAD-IC family P-type ATPase [Dehalococcoidia bacterium]|nr:HAD-IC family P-type ATPase [Dehalococcoidia bacterium]MDW8119678.1 HAD-IC family P-type ATPase [Chloroflexota bacterium]